MLRLRSRLFQKGSFLVLRSNHSGVVVKFTKEPRVIDETFQESMKQALDKTVETVVTAEKVMRQKGLHTCSIEVNSTFEGQPASGLINVKIQKVITNPYEDL